MDRSSSPDRHGALSDDGLIFPLRHSNQRLRPETIESNLSSRPSKTPAMDLNEKVQLRQPTG